MIWGKGKTDKASKQTPNEAPNDATAPAAPPVADPPAVPPEADAQSAGQRKSYLAMAETSQKARFAQLFSQGVAVLMRDQNYRNMPIGNLEFLLVPAVATGQCVIAHTKIGDKGPTVPVAIALWASVSDAVDKALGENLEKPPQLKPADWTSGSNTWLITLAGEPSIMNGFMQQLLQKDLKGKTVKMRTIDKAGRREVRTLQGAAG